MEALGTKRTKRGSSPGVDRLSALPDHLLHEIMSRMKARQVMRTRFLSRRWRHLWPSVPCLDVDQREFADTDYHKFGDFLHFLLLRVSVSDLDALRLHVSSTYDDSHVADASATIRRAVMSSAVHGEPTWRLKRLHLSGLRLDDLFAEHVRSRCPFLEHLELSRCVCGFHAIASGSLQCLALVDCEGKGFSEITSPSLKNLAIENGSTNDVTSPLVVAAPALACLSLVVTPFNFPGGVSFSEMPSLAKASIRLKVLGEESTAFPEFKNLRSLELNGCGENELQVSGHILRNSPNLEKLTLSPPCRQVLVAGSLSYPEFKNIRILILGDWEIGKYDLNHDSQTLGYFLHSLSMLEKLTLQRCKLSPNVKKQRGTSKKKNAVQNLMDIQCKNLRLTEIIYTDDEVVKLIIELLLPFSRNLPNNNIRLTKVE
ncbi:hypothetical protein HU200_005798 [Digitaria exilis]|uniref:F-box domain-containing protein n=1 Tax=Digitaria exilis TaxID=1010633 RepID=A0A835FR55_9POAL|nr:hypothetical protein HU200_005798 [Digitaria exilis]